MNEWMSWELLGTMAGACILANLITEIVKYIFPNVKAFILKLVALFVSVGAVLVTQVFIPQIYEWQNILLAVLNGLLVFAETQGIYSLVKDKLNELADTIFESGR